MGEEEFWQENGINPYALAKALFAAKGDVPFMVQLILKARKLFPTG
jgi:hypothetical protein